MSAGHDHHDNHSSEPKTVSFRTPMILALVTVLIIVLAVNACDKKDHCCEDGAKCEMKAGKHGEHGGHEEGHTKAGHEATEKHDEPAQEVAPVAADSAAVPTATTEAAAHH